MVGSNLLSGWREEDPPGPPNRSPAPPTDDDCDDMEEVDDGDEVDNEGVWWMVMVVVGCLAVSATAASVFGGVGFLCCWRLGVVVVVILMMDRYSQFSPSFYRRQTKMDVAHSTTMCTGCDAHFMSQ